MSNFSTPKDPAKQFTFSACGLTFNARVWPEEDGFVSLCIENGVSSYGDTEEEALEMLAEAVELYLETESDRK